jgi:hypothetical protein
MRVDWQRMGEHQADSLIWQFHQLWSQVLPRESVEIGKGCQY